MTLLSCSATEQRDAIASPPVIEATATDWQPGEWYKAGTVDDMQRFYRSRLPDIREAAREHGYAIGVHGSERRDFDLMAMPWRDDASDHDTLAHAIAMAACGITRSGAYQWTQKPLGRVAVSIPVCWTSRHDVISDGHIDLSVMPATVKPLASPPAQEAPTPQTREQVQAAFVADLQAVLNKWGAELEARDHYPECGEDVRMTVTIPSIYHELVTVREWTEIDLGSYMKAEGA